MGAEYLKSTNPLPELYAPVSELGIANIEVAAKILGGQAAINESLELPDTIVPGSD